ncbi:Arc family DNA-binding protein [Microvirga arsenatis]|uniref:Arc family DNA-binding protein n=1 Tax=Microvirga arsenatis TaxID=2692265 RepID=A0ABW9YVE8_9HYPH|nr:Arc family DNA-binding protein [Microvirga arsenatis]NBJ24125.1 Arc family DNA-binding protein [Microvirga arsenatis]
MARGDPHMRVRIPQDLRERLRASAQTNFRTMNAELVFQLDRSLPRQGEKNDDGVKFGDRAPSSSQSAPVTSRA